MDRKKPKQPTTTAKEKMVEAIGEPEIAGEERLEDAVEEIERNTRDDEPPGHRQR